MPLPTDPLLSSQWHLRETIAGLLDLNLVGVWNPTEGPAYTGAGTRVFVVDSGIDFNHADLAPNYNLALDFDFETSGLSAFGSATESHGTAVAGIIGADDNGTGAVGVAFDTNLVGYRTVQVIGDAWLRNVRDAIFFGGSAERFGDVVNISQGISNDTASEFGVGYAAARFDEIENSIGSAVSTGRGGLGATIVKSAGNARAAGYDVNADDWANDTRQVVVAAVDRNGFVSSYSSYGAAVLVSAFGTPGQVFTTDRVGAAGYAGGDFTSGFNGTSAAAPMVSGVVALMYDANAGLGWRDVQTILGASARQVGSEVGFGAAGNERFAWTFNGAQTWNGGGQHFSNDYGFGLVDAHAAVRMAETWNLTGTVAARSSNELSNVMDVLNSGVILPDADPSGFVFSGAAIFNDVVERVTVQMTFSTTFTGDLEVYLTSPSGTVSRLIADTGGSNDFSGVWTFESQAFRGERARGSWSVRVADDAGGDVLTVSDVVIRTFGASTLDDRYVFTNEYSDYDGIHRHATAISDTNGGVDTVNAAAVTTGSIIDLAGGASVIDGVGVSFAGIENAIGGDAGDTLRGDGWSNKLFGMRGADLLNGGAGIDTVDGGAGADRIVDADGVGGDALRGGDGIDMVDYGQVAFAPGATIDLAVGRVTASGGATETILGFEQVRGSQGGETIRGTAGANLILGEGGADVIFAGGGVDTVQGGAGNDRVVDTDFVDFDVLRGDDGVDTIDYGQIAFADGFVTIDLGLGRTSVSGGNVETISGFENAIGSQGGETIRGSGGANLLVGAGGSDVLVGGLGRDLLQGGDGADRFVFALKADSTFSAGATTCDVIQQAGGVAFANPGALAGDLIDLAGVDANEGLAGNQAFVFGGAGIGRLQCVASGADTLVLGYTNAAAGADFQIVIQDGGVLASAYSTHDFVL